MTLTFEYCPMEKKSINRFKVNYDITRIFEGGRR
jgi:hypothetical protein